MTRKAARLAMGQGRQPMCARSEAHCLPKQNNSRNMIMMHPTTKSSEIQGSLYWMPLVDMIAAWRASCTAMAPCKASSSISSSACCSLILLGEGHERVVVARASRHEGEKKPTQRVYLPAHHRRS